MVARTPLVLGDDGLTQRLQPGDVLVGAFDPSLIFHAKTDCLLPTATFDDGYQFAVSGTGAAWASQAPDSSTAVGVARLALGTAVGNRGSISSPDLSCLRLGGGSPASFMGRAKLLALSTTLSGYVVRMGFLDSVTGEPVDGVFVRYTHSTNSGKLQGVCRSNNVESVVDLGVTPVANNWGNFEIGVNAAGTLASFVIDNAAPVTLSTNIPTASGRETSFGLSVIRSVGITALSPIDVDYLETQVLFGAAR